MEKQFQSKSVPKGTRTIWRYLGALFILFTFAIGNVWGTATNFHTFVAAGDTIIDIEGTSTPSTKMAAVNGTDWAAVSTSAKNNSIYRMNPSTEEVATSKTNVYGTKLGPSAKSTYKVTGVSNVIFYVGTGTAGRISKLDVTEDGKSKVSEAASVTLSDKNNSYKMSYALDPSKSYTLEAYADADLFCYAVKFTVAPDCEEPATALSLGSNAVAPIYAGTEITFSTSGGNGGTITIAGAASETISANKWTATEGVHTFTASQPKTDGKCAQEAELKLTVLAATPVSAVTVGGPANGYKNNEVIFAATAANATQYEWYVDETKQGSDSAKLHFTPTESKTYSIVCKAKNAYNSDWVASTAHSLTVTSLYGELIRATLTGGNNATMTGIVGGTFDSNLGSGKYKLDDDRYMGVQLASGTFQEGDTVIIKMTTAGSNYPCLFADKERNTLLYLATETSSALEYKMVLPSAVNNKNTVYLSRHDDDYKWNPVVEYISVVRPMPAKSVAYDLTDVKINGTAISADDLATLKTGDAYLLELMAGYAAAPVVKFARQTTTTYEDDSQKVANDTITVTASEVSSKWQAQATIGTITYTVKAAKQSSAKLYYYNGASKLGEETVAINGNPEEYATYQAKVKLATFVDWYNNADLAEEHKITDISAFEITSDTIVYGKWTYTYAQSVNVEKWVLDNTKTPNETKTGNLISLLGTSGFASNLAYVEKNLELDSLNDGKGTGRNYTYLGLKVKVAGKMLDFRLAKDNTVKVKFGNVGATPLLAINGGEYAAMTIEDGVFAYTATGNDYISIKTATDAAVVFQQIMIGEDIQDVTLPEPTRHAVVLNKAGEAEHGTLAVASPEAYNWLAEDAAVTLTVTADEGYYIESVTLNGEALTPSENVYSFAMPNATANVVATFAEIVPNNVTYKANNGGEDADILAENATEIAGCSFTYAGHKFYGWNTAPDGTGDAYAPGNPVLSPLTLYAQWKEYFVITYKDGEDVLGTEDVFVGDAPVGIAAPVKAMNIFQGWTEEGSEDLVDVATLTVAKMLYAKWEAIDACFYFAAKSVTEDEDITAPATLSNAFGGSVEATDGTFKYSQYGVLIEGGSAKYFTVNLDYALQEGSKIALKLYAGGTSDRGLNLRVAGSSSNVYQYKWTPSATEPAQMEYEYEYVVPENSPLIGKKVFYLYRNNNVYLQTVKVKDCAPQDYTVTYKDGETVLGTEQVFENEHPTADGINTHKKGYEFQGWAETADGDVVDLDDITITAVKNLFAQYTVKDCSPKGVKFSMAIDGSKISANQYYPATTPAVGDLAVFATVTGGVAQAVNTSTGTTKNFEVKTTPEFKLGGSNSHMRILLDCPLAENDTIKFTKTERITLSFDSLKTKSENIAKTTSYYIVPAAYAGEDTIHIWYNSNGVSVNGVQVIRPEIYTVSFDLSGQGSSAINPIDVVKGGKVTAPTAPEDDDYAFAGWYKENTLSNEWNFNVDVVTANTTLYARWIDLSDATLKSLKYGAEEIALQAGVYTYNVELPALTTAVPALTAETSNPSATMEITDATEFDAEGHATSTVVVTPEKVGAATQTYTVNFAKATSVALQDVTGSITWDFNGAVTADVNINNTLTVIANYAGVSLDGADKLEVKGTKFMKSPACVRANQMHFYTTVPGKLTVEYSNTGGNAVRYLYVNGVKYDEAGTESTTKKGGDTKVFVPAGDVELVMMDGSDASKELNIYSIIFNATSDYPRNVSSNYGTLCVEHNVPAGQYFGATFYQIASRNEDYDYKIDFEEVLPNEELKAGEPYLFKSNTGRIDLFYGEETAADPIPVRGMIGNYDESQLAITAENMKTIYYFAQNKLWTCDNLVGGYLTLNEHRAYIDLTQVPTYAEYEASKQQQQNSAPRRRVSLEMNGTHVATGIDELNASEKPMKMIINGQLFIIRGEKMYDAKGQLVK